MSTSLLCSYCYCFNGQQKCIKPKCLLPAPSCRPIWSDSSCCPIRYDCSGHTAVNNELQPAIQRLSDNKHYLRLMSRTQRSRGMRWSHSHLNIIFLIFENNKPFSVSSHAIPGCIVNATFYAEGQRLPTNRSQPCVICFCIRGKSECVPKKCAPSIRNCRPIIPDGECYPESYDCGNWEVYAYIPHSWFWYSNWNWVCERRRCDWTGPNILGDVGKA